MNTIDYRNIADALEFYQGCGYTYVEVPWYVTREIMDITRPKYVPEDMDYYIPKNDKCLVASAEQSFLYLIVKGILQPGKYVGVTPCYRFEPINQLHRKVFMKVELIEFGGVNDIVRKNMDDMVFDAMSFFADKLNGTITKVEKTPENSLVGLDLEYSMEELGSYGIRQHRNMMWVYGTGCAEPRLSIIQSTDKGR